MFEPQTEKLICPKCGADGHATWLDNRRRLTSLKIFSKRFKAVESAADVKFVCKECNQVAAPVPAGNSGSQARQGL